MIDIPVVMDVDIAFGGGCKHLPKMEDIPHEFKEHGDNKWLKAQRDWFYNGVKKSQFVPKDGVDSGKAFRLLASIQGSFEPSHEHKEAGVAYLMSQFFDDYKP